MSFALLLPALAVGSVRLSCETTVDVADGKLEIELWPHTAPHGVRRVIELVEAGWFTNLPFFHAIEGFQVLFGVQPDKEKQSMWQYKDIRDDDPPQVQIPPTEGVLCFSGDPGKGADSRAALMFMTLEAKQLWKHRRRPWEVPVGRVSAGLDVLKGIYSGYGDEPQMRWLNPTVQRPASVPDAAAYLAHYSKLDSFRSCSVVRDAQPSSDPNRPGHDEL